MTPCTCTAQGFQPIWRTHVSGPIYCLHCGHRHVSEAPDGWPVLPEVPELPNIEHKVAVAVLLAAALTPDLPEPP